MKSTTLLYHVPIKRTKMWSIVTSKVFICTKILLWNFLNPIDIFIFSAGLYVKNFAESPPYFCPM